MNIENITTPFEVGDHIIRRRDGKVGQIIKIHDDICRYGVRFAEDDPDTQLSEGEILPVTKDGIAAALEPKIEEETTITDWPESPVLRAPSDEILLEGLEWAREGEIRQRLAVALIRGHRKIENALHTLETTDIDPRIIATNLDLHIPLDGLDAGGSKSAEAGAEQKPEEQKPEEQKPEVEQKIEQKPEVDEAAIDPDSEAAIPSFDPKWINGIYADFVELITRGTTLAPQFAFVIAKTIVGLRIAGKVNFEDLDVEPRFYAALIGQTGSGKGEAWRRAFEVIQPEGYLVGPGFKVINSADSGAGLKDVFFEKPENEPVLCFVDEIENLGNKSANTRNPGILDTMIELADSTSISRILSKNSGGGSKSKSDARLAMVMCGQDGEVYAKSFAGRTKLGWWDRLYPEYGVPQETGDLPPIDPGDAIKLLVKKLDPLVSTAGVMRFRPEVKHALEAFWKDQEDSVRKKARWKKHLIVDCYMSAFGRGVHEVEMEDLLIAIAIHQRQMVIRRVCFSTEVPDRIGFYLDALKRITGRMERQIKAGASPEKVAKTRRDFETEAHAYRDNELHIFDRAWNVYAPVYLAKLRIQKGNGQVYVKFGPAENGLCMNR